MYLGGIDFLSMKSLSTTFPPHWKTASHALPGNHFIVTRIHPEILHYLNLGCHLTKVSIANWQRLKERVKSHICPCVQRKGKSIHCNALQYHITTFLSLPGALYMTNRPMEQLTLRNWRTTATNHGSAKKMGNSTEATDAHEPRFGALSISSGISKNTGSNTIVNRERLAQLQLYQQQ